MCSQHHLVTSIGISEQTANLNRAGSCRIGVAPIVEVEATFRPNFRSSILLRSACHLVGRCQFCQSTDGGSKNTSHCVLVRSVMTVAHFRKGIQQMRITVRKRSLLRRTQHMTIVKPTDVQPRVPGMVCTYWPLGTTGLPHRVCCAAVIIEIIELFEPAPRHDNGLSHARCIES